MPAHNSVNTSTQEPLRRFYPSQDNAPGQPLIGTPSVSATGRLISSHKKRDDVSYLSHRHPFLLQRLYEAADSLLDTYPKKSFLYDTYPDYLSLGWLRDRLLRQTPELTQAFLQEGCPIFWLNQLADLIISELLIRRRRA